MLYFYFRIWWQLVLEFPCIGRRQYPVFRELVRDCPQAHIQLNKHMEYRHPDGGLFLVNHIPGFFFILPIPPIEAPSGPYRQTDLYARLPTPVRIFYDLMALAFGAPGQNRADKLTGQAVVNVLTDAHDLSAIALNLLKDHGRVHEVTREAAQVKDNNHISHAVTDKLPGKRQLFAERIVNEAAFCLFENDNDINIVQLGVATAFVFLVFQALAVLLLLVG